MYILHLAFQPIKSVVMLELRNSHNVIINASPVMTLVAQCENNGIFQDPSHKNCSLYQKTSLIIGFSMLEIYYTVSSVKFSVIDFHMPKLPHRDDWGLNLCLLTNSDATNVTQIWYK